MARLVNRTILALARLHPLKKSKPIPFPFVVEQLYSLDPVIKPMFGCHAIYVRNKIMLMLRYREDFPDDNGVWIASARDDMASLKNEFPSLRPIGLFGEMATTWQNIPLGADSFEADVNNICELILKKDARIGKIPKAKNKKKT
jgi:hypothetical protein